MIDNRKASRFVEKLFAHGYFFFFSYQIFSPLIGGKTLYLEYLFIAFNPFFWTWVFNLRLNVRVLLAVVAGVILVPFYTVAAIKLVAMLAGVMFLVYAFERRVFLLHSYIAFSVLVALAQFALTMSGHSAQAAWIGPSHLAQMVWGPYATQTFTNFYTIFLIPRVSGLSREAGFFASFLIGGILALLINRRLTDEQVGWRYPSVYLIGFLISFSKISAAIVPAFILVAGRKIIDKIPLFFIGVAFLAALVVFWNHFQAFLFLDRNGTFLGRFGAYALIDNLTLRQMLFGVKDVAEVNSPVTSLISSFGYTQLYGLGGWFVANGAIAFFMYTVALRVLGIRGAGFLFVLLMTATVGIDTNQNFCVLAYYVAFMLPKVKTFRVRKRSDRVAPAADRNTAVGTPVPAV